MKRRSRTLRLSSPPPAGGCVRVNNHIGRLVGGRDGRYLGAYLSFHRPDGSFVSDPRERRLLVGTALPLRPSDKAPPADQLPTNAQMEALAIEYGLNGHRRKTDG
jgi:hypothetical protein